MSTSTTFLVIEQAVSRLTIEMFVTMIGVGLLVGIATRAMKSKDLV